MHGDTRQGTSCTSWHAWGYETRDILYELTCMGIRDKGHPVRADMHGDTRDILYELTCMGIQGTSCTS